MEFIGKLEQVRMQYKTMIVQCVPSILQAILSDAGQVIVAKSDNDRTIYLDQKAALWLLCVILFWNVWNLGIFGLVDRNVTVGGDNWSLCVLLSLHIDMSLLLSINYNIWLVLWRTRGRDWQFRLLLRHFRTESVVFGNSKRTLWLHLLLNSFIYRKDWSLYCDCFKYFPSFSSIYICGSFAMLQKPPGG